MGILYTIFSLLDYAVFHFCGLMFSVISDLAGYTIFNATDIKAFANRVYMIVGVLMLFKLVISCVRFIVDPDKLSDKDNGIGGILKRTIFSVVLIAIVPTIFEFALTAQTVILESLPSAILGGDIIRKDEMVGIGEDMSFKVLTAFIRDTKSSSDTSKGNIKDLGSFLSNIGEGCSIIGGGCRYEYTIFISTATGICLLLMLLSMAIDISVRTIKFSILQILAPIPISSYIDPKTSKSTFNTWVKISTQVYVDLFTRMIVLYFIVYFLRIMINVENIAKLYAEFGAGEGTVILVILILGLVFFAKSAPKFIGDVLGLKGTTDGMTAMFKRAAGFAGSARAGFNAMRSNYVAQKERLDAINRDEKLANRLKAAASGIAGASSALTRGVKNSTLKGQGFKDAYKNAFNDTVKARNRRNDMRDVVLSSDYQRVDYRRDVRRDRLQIPSNDSFLESQYKIIQDAAKGVADLKGKGASKMNETPGRYKIQVVPGEKGVGLTFDEVELLTKFGFKDKGISIGDIRTLDKNADTGNLKYNVEVFDAQGNKTIEERSINQDEAGLIKDLVQKIEKRTSYLATAHYVGNHDPGFQPGFDSMRANLTTNRSFFTDPEVVKQVSKKFEEYGFNDVASYQDMMMKIEYLNTDNKLISYPKKKEGMSDQEYKGLLDKYYEESKKRANIVSAFKEVFEQVATERNKIALDAKARMEKAKNAINNDKK